MVGNGKSKPGRKRLLKMRDEQQQRPELAAINSPAVYKVLWANRKTYYKGMMAKQIRDALKASGVELTSQHIGHVLVRLERMGYVRQSASAQSHISIWRVSALAIKQGLAEVGSPITPTPIKTEVIKIPLWATKDPQYAKMSMKQLKERFGGQAS